MSCSAIVVLFYFLCKSASVFTCYLVLMSQTLAQDITTLQVLSACYCLAVKI